MLSPYHDSGGVGRILRAQPLSRFALLSYLIILHLVFLLQVSMVRGVPSRSTRHLVTVLTFWPSIKPQLSLFIMPFRHNLFEESS